MTGSRDPGSEIGQNNSRASFLRDGYGFRERRRIDINEVPGCVHGRCGQHQRRGCAYAARGGEGGRIICAQSRGCWWHRGTAAVARRLGGLAARLLGSLVAWRLGGSTARRLDGSLARRLGDSAAARLFGSAIRLLDGSSLSKTRGLGGSAARPFGGSAETRRLVGGSMAGQRLDCSVAARRLVCATARLLRCSAARRLGFAAARRFGGSWTCGLSGCSASQQRLCGDPTLSSLIPFHSFQVLRSRRLAGDSVAARLRLGATRRWLGGGSAAARRRHGGGTTILRHRRRLVDTAARRLGGSTARQLSGSSCLAALRLSGLGGFTDRRLGLVAWRLNELATGGGSVAARRRLGGGSAAARRQLGGGGSAAARRLGDSETRRLYDSAALKLGGGSAAAQRQLSGSSAAAQRQLGGGSAAARRRLGGGLAAARRRLGGGSVLRPRRLYSSTARRLGDPAARRLSRLSARRLGGPRPPIFTHAISADIALLGINTHTELIAWKQRPHAEDTWRSWPIPIVAAGT